MSGQPRTSITSKERMECNAILRKSHPPQVHHAVRADGMGVWPSAETLQDVFRISGMTFEVHPVSGFVDAVIEGLTDGTDEGAVSALFETYQPAVHVRLHDMFDFLDNLPHDSPYVRHSSDGTMSITSRLPFSHLPAVTALSMEGSSPGFISQCLDFAAADPVADEAMLAEGVGMPIIADAYRMLEPDLGSGPDVLAMKRLSDKVGKQRVFNGKIINQLNTVMRTYGVQGRLAPVPESVPYWNADMACAYADLLTLKPYDTEREMDDEAAEFIASEPFQGHSMRFASMIMTLYGMMTRPGVSRPREWWIMDTVERLLHIRDALNESGIDEDDTVSHELMAGIIEGLPDDYLIETFKARMMIDEKEQT